MSNFWGGPLLLTMTWVIPLVIVMIMLPMAADDHQKIKKVNLIGSGINLLIIFFLSAKLIYASFNGLIPDLGRESSLLWSYHAQWFTALNIEYFIGVDAISMLMMALTAIVIFCGVFASWGIKTQAKEYFVLLNILVSGVYGVFISFDLFTFFLFYEIAVLPMYLLIGLWGTGKKEYAAMKLVLMLVAGSAFIFAGILGLYYASGIESFSIIKLSQVPFPMAFQKWAFPLLFMGFGVLGALFPFHTWSPDGHASAPTAVSMLHAGVLMKLGGYGCLRVAMYLLPEGAHYWMGVVLILTTINVVYGAFAAIRQTDLKYVTAYSSVSHCGLVLFSLAAMNVIGFKGAVLQMISHGLMTALFFCLIGMIYGRTHTRIMSEMGGLMKITPFLSVAFVIAGFAGLGLPSLSGFVAEATIFVGAFANQNPINRICTIMVIASIVVTAVYVLRAANKMLTGPLDPKYIGIKDCCLVERIPVVILISCLFIMGLMPGWIIKLVDIAVKPIYLNIMR